MMVTEKISLYCKFSHIATQENKQETGEHNQQPTRTAAKLETKKTGTNHINEKADGKEQNKLQNKSPKTEIHK